MFVNTSALLWAKITQAMETQEKKNEKDQNRNNKQQSEDKS